ncbi:MAG: hypothetical protein NTU44_12915 [Bacteroidetes bacterium]|nr:hypothetical protein [Bacteroidota bacterium]
MKKAGILIVVCLLSVSGFSQNMISGFVRYDNAVGTAMADSCTVTLSIGYVQYAQCQVIAGGFYSFANLPPGNYQLKAITGKKWHGVDIIDAYLVLLNFLNPGTLTGLWLQAADVNGTGGTPNAVDALAMARRWVGQINNFFPPNVPSGGPDFYSEVFNITVTPTSNLSQDIHILFAGDVDGDAY